MNEIKKNKYFSKTYGDKLKGIYILDTFFDIHNTYNTYINIYIKCNKFSLKCDKILYKYTNELKLEA